MLTTENVVVITGASAGIGAALARELGARKHLLVLAARREADLARVAEEAKTQTLTVVADVTKRADVERIRDEAIAKFGHIDVWINNAGRGISRSVLDLSDDDVDAMISVNLKSALYGMQAVVPYFKERGRGHVINVSSFLAKVPLATIRSAYSASKAALNSLSGSLRLELLATHPHVHVSVVMPGIVTTEFGKNALGTTASARPPGAATGPFAPQSPEEVALAIASLIETPMAELYTNPPHPGIARQYGEDPGAFEAQLTARFAPPLAKP